MKTVFTIIVMLALLLTRPGSGFGAVLFELPLKFKLTARSQGVTRQTDNSIKLSVEKTRITNKDILDLLGKPAASKLFVRVETEDGGIVKSIFAGSDDVTDDLRDLLGLEFITLSIDEILGGNLGAGVVIKGGAQASSSKGSASVVLTTVLDPGPISIGSATVNVSTLFNATVRVRVNSREAKVSWHQQGEVIGVGTLDEDGDTTDFVITGSWSTAGSGSIDPELIDTLPD